MIHSAPCRLRKVKIDISSLPITTGRRCIRNGGDISGIFLPAVERLVRKSYGEGVTLADVLHEIQAAERELRDKRCKAQEVYRKKQQTILWSYIKEVWDLLGNFARHDYLPQFSVTNDRQQLANIRETRTGGLDMYGYLPSDEALLEHVPFLGAIATYIPSGKLEHGWFLSNTSFPSPTNDPTVVIYRKSRWYTPEWHNMRWDMRVDQKPAWFVEAAWRVLVDTIIAPLNFTLSLGMRFIDGLQTTFIAALNKDLFPKVPYAWVEAGDDMERVWLRLALIWLTAGEVAGWPWRDQVPEDVRNNLIRLGQDFQRGMKDHSARFGIQLHELGTRALPCPSEN